MVGPGQDYFFRVWLLGKIWEKSRNKQDGTGLLTTTRESLELFPIVAIYSILRLFPGNLYYIKIINFHLGSVREFLNVSRPHTSREKASQNAGTKLGQGTFSSRMLGVLLFWIFPGKFWYPENGIQERRPLPKGLLQVLRTAVKHEYFCPIVIQLEKRQTMSKRYFYFD